jgi:hypothetical protein
MLAWRLSSSSVDRGTSTMVVDLAGAWEPLVPALYADSSLSRSPHHRLHQALGTSGSRRRPVSVRVDDVLRFVQDDVRGAASARVPRRSNADIPLLSPAPSTTATPSAPATGSTPPVHVADSPSPPLPIPAVAVVLFVPTRPYVSVRARNLQPRLRVQGS